LKLWLRVLEQELIKFRNKQKKTDWLTDIL